ncbi:MAG: glycosyltransferase [Lachnospiraceae bacterium]|nr:glycosyltransferase [Lachnospiraceae bacterium]
MENFEYKVSVIVPVYNVEQYLRRCLDSLLAQTIDHEQMEVLLINDGSTDNSIVICDEYARLFPCFKVFSQENAGVSVARNVGIRNAKGKYIMFLDSDDALSEITLKNVVDFFDEHYNEIDIVSYYDQYYINGEEAVTHLRYKYLNKTGVYDLNEIFFAFQVRLSLCCKNKLNKNILFTVGMNYQEDQEFCSRLIRKNMKLGYVKEATYYYFRNDEGLVSASNNALNSFESSVAYFEELFSSFDNIPKYFQAIFFHDISWKFSSSTLYPYHYNESELKKAKDRIVNLLDKVENDIIMSYPNLDNYQKLYWIRQKSICHETPFFSRNQLMLLCDGMILYKRQDVEIIVKRIQIQSNILKLIGYFKSPFFSYDDKFKLFMNINGKIEELPLVAASSSYYKAKEKTENFWMLIFEKEITEKTIVEFYVEFAGIKYKTIFWNSNTTPFYNDFLSEYSAGRLTVGQNRNGFEITPIEVGKEKYAVEESIRKISDKVANEIKQCRNIFKLSKRHIWLYYDNHTVLKGNGYYQFIHDVVKDDGILRYYIHTRKEKDDEFLFNVEMRAHIIEFGSMAHKILFLEAEKILTSFVEIESLIPFEKESLHQVLDIFNAEIIYLQHGVLHAHLPWYYSPIGVSVDKVVVSTDFEMKNFVSIYGFRKQDLIPTGMACYDYVHKNNIPQAKKIIFAPSWRSYLIGPIKEGNEKRLGLDSKFFKSSYFQNISAFLQSHRLLEILAKKGIEMSIKLHPNFLTTYGKQVDFENEYVKLAAPNVQLDEFSLFITDFSSYVFEYAYLSRAVMYFVPDYIEFKSGMNHYRELDLPFDKAFGNLTTDPESAVDEVIRIIENDFVPDAIFKERMDKFYLPLENCAEKLYCHLTGGGN